MCFCKDYVLTLLQNQNTSENIVSWGGLTTIRTSGNSLSNQNYKENSDHFSISDFMPETLEKMFSKEARFVEKENLTHTYTYYQ